MASAAGGANRKTGQELLAGLRQLVARGATLRQMAAQLDRPPTTLYRLARKNRLPLRRRCLSGEKHIALRRLMARGFGGRRLAAAAGVSRSTAWRHQQRSGLVRLKDLAAPLPCKPWRCPGCGCKLKLSICIRCNFRKPTRVARRPPPGTSETPPG